MSALPPLEVGVALEACRLSKRLGPGDGEPVFTDFSLSLRANEVLAIVGPNGAGKTTLLQVLAGLVPPDEGTVRLAGRGARTMLVFQDVAGSLLPWRSNLDNIALPLEVAGASRLERLEQTRRCLRAWGNGVDVLTQLGIPHEGYPSTLSGGQQQWLSILRAYVVGSATVLLDEPFAALDVHGRLLAQARLAALADREPRATIIVSHELDGAVFLADRVLVLSRRPARVLAQVDVDLPRPRPALEAVLNDPRFVACCRDVQRAFIGALT